MHQLMNDFMLQQKAMMEQLTNMKGEIASIKQIARARSRSASPERRADPSTMADSTRSAPEGAGVEGLSSHARAAPASTAPEVLFAPPVAT